MDAILLLTFLMNLWNEMNVIVIGIVLAGETLSGSGGGGGGICDTGGDKAIDDDRNLKGNRWFLINCTGN